MSYKRRKIEILINDKTFIAPSTSYAATTEALNEQVANRQLKIVFEIMIDFSNFHSYCDCSIYNLSENSIANLFKKGAVFGLKAGYEDTIDYLFKGKIRNTYKERDGADTITRVICRGGSQPKATQNRTSGVNAKVSDIIKTCVNSMGYALVMNDADFADVKPYARGYTLKTDPVVNLDALALAHNFSYALELDRVIVVRDGKFRAGTPHIVSAKNGMIGIPEISEVGCDVSVRLQPKLKIGGRINIKSDLKTFNFGAVYYKGIPNNTGEGVYIIKKLTHSGDTYGDEWTSKIEAQR